MKYLFLHMLLACAALQTHAQTAATLPDVLTATTQPAVAFRFGYFSYKAAFEAMPDYAIAKQNLDDLRIQYDKEMKRVENEFNKKYEDFLEGQRDFAPSILQKRQAELQEMMEKNMAFKQEAKRLLEQAEANAYQPLREKLANAILNVGKGKALAFIINTDDNAVPFIDVNLGENVSAAIAAAIR